MNGVKMVVQLSLVLIMLTTVGIIGLSQANASTFTGNLTATQVVMVGLIGTFAFLGLAWGFIKDSGIVNA